MAHQAGDLVTRSSFQTEDPQLAGQFLAEAYADNAMRVRGVPQRFRLRQVRYSAGTVWLDDYRNTMDVAYRTEPLGHLLVAQVSAGRFERSTEGVTEQYGPGDVFLLAEPDLPHSCRSEDAQVKLVGLAPSTAELARPDGVPRPRLTGMQPRTAADRRSWRRGVQYLQAVLADENATASPLVVGNATRFVTELFLATFPHTAVEEPSVTERHDVNPVTVRRAMAYLEEHAHEPVSLTELAFAVGMTPRGLQHAFRRHLGTTPMACLKRIRLAAAHRDLVNADPDRGDTVTRIASGWGFAHLSRFAADYRTAYGRHPGRTLAS
ncbi:helix-turn-helix domain-containing protein [Amycolatopsis jiangsuensis]|uniref:AraC-like DNA-binding protein n=1 Tax=Amycolatopsis jiangsuensis TaxID=1181879 RepID=A0A840J6V3_9PSEU|nr:AraC family transcriptional regulator [Amycolatopsis jiangsuensis]MBB4689134.1 AraC-like DNA-binding protein [Amycolatopsis jiangsuensis]